MKYRYIFNLRVLVVLVLLAASFSCSKEPAPQNEWVAPEGMVPLELAPVSMYGYMPNRPSSKSVSNEDLAGISPSLLTENSTMRLIVMKNEPEGNVVMADNLIPGDFVYVIMTDKYGNVYPQPCKADDDGTLVPGSITAEPYYLPVSENSAGTNYYCMAISPAKKLIEDTDGIMKVAVKNKESILVTNNYWEETEFNFFNVSNKVTDKATAHLNPLFYGTALIRIKIVNGDHVTTLFPGNPLLGFDRVATDPGQVWTGDKSDTATGEDVDSDTPGIQHKMPDYNLVIGKEIEPQMGNNILYNRLFVSDYDMTESYIETPSGSGKWTKNIVVTTETNILPIDARPTPMIIKLNIYVNETPMQFQFQTNEIFKPGHVYNYTATIKLDPNNIYIASWQDVSWSWSLDPDDVVD